MNNLKCKKYRTKKYIQYIYCTVKKRKIQESECCGCKDKEYKKSNPLKQRTSKQAQAERKRYSVFTDDLTKCIECGCTLSIEKHEIFNGTNRHTSMRYGFVIPLCPEHHTFPTSGIHFNKLLKRKWQNRAKIEFLKNHTEEQFIEVFGRSYI